MEFGGINFLAVLIAAIASFVAGAVWYGVLSKPWMAAAGVSADQAQPKPLILLNAFACLLIMAFVLAGLIGHLGIGQVTARNGIISAAFVWVGFVVTTQLINHRFQGKPVALSVIDLGHWLLVFLIQGAIIGFIGVA